MGWLLEPKGCLANYCKGSSSCHYQEKFVAIGSLSFSSSPFPSFPFFPSWCVFHLENILVHNGWDQLWITSMSAGRRDPSLPSKIVEKKHLGWQIPLLLGEKEKRNRWTLTFWWGTVRMGIWGECMTWPLNREKPNHTHFRVLICQVINLLLVMSK